MGKVYAKREKRNVIQNYTHSIPIKPQNQKMIQCGGLSDYVPDRVKNAASLVSSGVKGAMGLGSSVAKRTADAASGTFWTGVDTIATRGKNYKDIISPSRWRMFNYGAAVENHEFEKKNKAYHTGARHGAYNTLWNIKSRSTNQINDVSRKKLQDEASKNDKEKQKLRRDAKREADPTKKKKFIDTADKLEKISSELRAKAKAGKKSNMYNSKTGKKDIPKAEPTGRFNSSSYEQMARKGAKLQFEKASKGKKPSQLSWGDIPNARDNGYWKCKLTFNDKKIGTSYDGKNFKEVSSVMVGVNYKVTKSKSKKKPSKLEAQLNQLYPIDQRDKVDEGNKKFMIYMKDNSFGKEYKV